MRKYATMEYSRDQVNRLVTEGTLDSEENVDFWQALTRLPAPQKLYILDRYLGFSATQAMSRCGIPGNATRYHEAAVSALTLAMNGETSEPEDSTNGFGAIRRDNDDGKAYG